MVVPAHDSRDYEFALKYDVPICWVVMPDDKSIESGKAFLGEGTILRDYLFARQRYWGELIPIIFLDDNGETVPLCETELPLILPELHDFSPTGSGEPPLSKAMSWLDGGSNVENLSLQNIQA
ncbi:hypothetical protein JHK82_050725 [Glycine max]|nr:hypothetical protein JHK86_050594 [Glycine max]KAG4936515.1 hypothetical protein JHK85_051434 [Glycine max]KAG5091947.1 hypothetical protein JHK82_050725 [Glycine max]KAG5095042.1 hypothetical protein JHK84_050630 [Glycine max]